MSRVFTAWETKPPFADTDVPLVLKAAQEAAGEAPSTTAKRVRLVKLAYELWHSGLDVDQALKLNDIPEASRVVKAGMADAEAIRSEYPKEIFLRQDVALYNRAGWCEYIACVNDSLDNLLKSKVTKPSPEPTAPGPEMCLTNNADIPQAQRIDSGVKATFLPSDVTASEGPKLFDGDVKGPEHAIYTGGFANMTIDLDMQKSYQIDHVEVCTGTNIGPSCLMNYRAVPIYIEVETSEDGKNFTAVDRILPRTLPGFVSSDRLMVSARYVKLVLYSLNYSQDVGEVRIWGRAKA